MKQLAKNIILFFLPFLIGIILLFMIPVNKKFSYNFVKGECDNKASWIYHCIFEDERNIDIAFTGASQTSCAIMDENIENELTNRTGRKINVTNLGYCRRGRDLQYVMLKELFEHKKPSVLIIEVAEDEPKKSHPVFPFLAENRDLLNPLVFYNQRYFSNLWKGTAIRFEYIKSKIFKNDYQNIVDNAKFGYMSSNQIATATDFAENKTDWVRRGSKLKPAMLRQFELNYSKHYIRKIVELAQNNNCKIKFLYLPESGSGLKLPVLNNFYTQFGELIILPDSIISNQQNWKDATHFNDNGARKTSEILFQVLNAIN
jgi:hypothetical protein